MGDGPIVASRNCDYSVKEIKEKYLDYETKYSSLNTAIDKCYLQAYEDGWITSPWTGTSFKCSSEVKEKDLKKILINDICLEKMIEDVDQLSEDDFFLIHKRKMMYVT